MDSKKRRAGVHSAPRHDKKTKKTDIQQVDFDDSSETVTMEDYSGQTSGEIYEEQADFQEYSTEAYPSEDYPEEYAEECPDDLSEDYSSEESMDGYEEEEYEDTEEDEFRTVYSVKKRAISHTLPFFLCFAVMTGLAWALPLRPTYSEIERRELETVPDFTFASLLSGEWTAGVSSWFSDTFPGREGWIKANDTFQSYFGKQTVAISGAMVASDTIDKSDKTESEIVAATPAPTPQSVYSIPTETTAVESTEAPEGSETEATPTAEPEAENVPEEQRDISEGADFATDNSTRLNATVYFDDTGYELYGLGKGAAEYYGTVLEKSAKRYAEKYGIRFFSMLCPNSGGINLSYDTYDQLYAVREDDAIDVFYTNATEKLIPVKVYDKLRSHNSEYLYFRTDHHWTALGAYYAYEEFCSVAGHDPVTLNNYSVLELPGFLGSFYKSANAKTREIMDENPDTVYAYVPDTSQINVESTNGGITKQIELVSDKSEAASDCKYLTFLEGGEQYQVVITNDAIEDDSCILVVKDSYANPFVVYLTQNYHTVIMMNIRNQFQAFRIIEKYGVKDILVLTELVLAQGNDFLGNLETIFRY